MEENYMAKVSPIPRKFDDKNPNVIAVRKYDEEIARLEDRYEQANKDHDWTMRSFYYNQLVAKRTNRENLVSSLKRSGIIFD